MQRKGSPKSRGHRSVQNPVSVRSLFAIPISDTGLALHKLVSDHCFDLDESGGVVLWWRPIGPPDLAGPIYKALRSPALAERDRLLAEEYRRLCNEAGGEDHYLRSTYHQLAKKYNALDDQRPLIVFVTDPPTDERAILTIAPSSLDDGDRRRDLACFLHQQLRGDRVLKFAHDEEFTPESMDALQKYTAAMSEAIASSIARGRGVPKKMWISYCVATGLVERPDPKVCATGEAELSEKGVLTLKIFTDGVLDGEVKFTALNPASAKQRQLMVLLLNAWPRGVHLRELGEAAYGADFLAPTDDPSVTAARSKRITQLFRDIRGKKLERARINPDVLPALNSPTCKRGMVALRLAKLKRIGFGHRD